MTVDNRIMALPLEEDPRVKIDGTIEFEEFKALHYACEADEDHLGTVNSHEVDSASGDPKPLFASRYHCFTHDVSSAVKTTEGF